MKKLKGTPISSLIPRLHLLILGWRCIVLAFLFHLRNLAGGVGMHYHTITQWISSPLLASILQPGKKPAVVMIFIVGFIPTLLAKFLRTLYYMDVKLTGSPIQNPNADVTPSEAMLVLLNSLGLILISVSLLFYFHTFIPFHLISISWQISDYR